MGKLPCLPAREFRQVAPVQGPTPCWTGFLRPLTLRGDCAAHRHDNGNRGNARGDRDHDGVPNRVDRDRDGDGVRNRYDSNPNNPNRN